MTRRRIDVITALVTCLAAGLLAGCATGNPGTAAPTATSPRPSGVAPSADPSSSPSPAGRRSVAIYYAANAGPAGVRLYREFHSRTRVDTVIRDAVDAMVNERPDDPDYRSLWPAGAQVHRASKSGDLATIDMEAAPAPATQQMAIQQLVWTATAADLQVRRVQILVQGRPLTPAPVGRAPAINTLAPVWLLIPGQGSVNGRTFPLSGDAAVFEATVSWEVRQGTTVIRRGFATATKGAPDRGTWRGTVTVPAAGTYQVVAFESSAKDGSPLFIDSKTITVT